MDPLRREVHIWYLPSAAATAGVLRQCDRVMSGDERTRRARFTFAVDRMQFTLTRGLIRTLLGRYLGADPARCRFTANRYGKPELANGPAGVPIQFNLAHARGMIVCALCLGSEIGVDVEALGRPVERSVADRFFSGEETAALRTVSDAAFTSRFLAYWTAKEAYVKARGAGLSLPLDGFAIRFDGPHPSIRFSSVLPDDPESWQVRQTSLPPGHLLAMAVRRSGPDLPVRIRPFDHGELGRPFDGPADDMTLPPPEMLL